MHFICYCNVHIHSSAILIKMVDCWVVGIWQPGNGIQQSDVFLQNHLPCLEGWCLTLKFRSSVPKHFGLCHNWKWIKTESKIVKIQTKNRRYAYFCCHLYSWVCKKKRKKKVYISRFITVSVLHGKMNTGRRVLASLFYILISDEKCMLCNGA